MRGNDVGLVDGPRQQPHSHYLLLYCCILISRYGVSCTGYLVLPTKWMYGRCPWISTTRHMSLYVLGYTHCGIGLCIVVQLFSTCSLSLEQVVWTYLCSSMLILHGLLSWITVYAALCLWAMAYTLYQLLWISVVA